MQPCFVVGVRCELRTPTVPCGQRERGRKREEKGGEEVGGAVQECAAGRLPWQVDEVRIMQAGVGVINARGNVRERKQDHKSAARPPC